LRDLTKVEDPSPALKRDLPVLKGPSNLKSSLCRVRNSFSTLPGFWGPQLGPQNPEEF